MAGALFLYLDIGLMPDKYIFFLLWLARNIVSWVFRLKMSHHGL
jgi:hypothetical protein